MTDHTNETIKTGCFIEHHHNYAGHFPTCPFIEKIILINQKNNIINNAVSILNSLIWLCKPLRIKQYIHVLKLQEYFGINSLYNMTHNSNCLGYNLYEDFFSIWVYFIRDTGPRL